jgi:hypothetical protein
MSENENEEVYLNQEFFVSEYIDDENFYVQVKYRKVEQWAFYLRLIGKWYFPCEKDQKKLKDLFLNSELRISTDNTRIGFNQEVNGDKIEYTFTLPFIHALPFYDFKPCAKCQKQIRSLITESMTLTIGNKDYSYPVELSRKNEDDDKSFETIEKHKATPLEKEQDSGWNRHSVSKEEYDKLPVIEE